MLRLRLCVSACLTVAALIMIFAFDMHPGERMVPEIVKLILKSRKTFAESFVKRELSMTTALAQLSPAIPPPGLELERRDSAIVERLLISKVTSVASGEGGIEASSQGNKGGQGNECNACPIFVTFGVTNGGSRTTSGLRGIATTMNSTTIFVNTIRLASHSLAHAHSGCWKLYIYTDNESILRKEHGISLLGKEVEIRMSPAFVENVYDRMGQKYSGRAYDAVFETRKRGYQSTSRCKFDLVQRHLDLGEKVIWMDLDTLIVSDMSCIYKELDHFVIAPGFQSNKDFWVVLAFNWTAPMGKSMPKWLARPIPGKHFVFGDLWMANIELIQAALDVETWLEKEYNARAQLDIQTYFSVLHYRNWTGLNDLARMERWKNYSWGFQHVDGFMLPYAKSSKNFHVGYANGTLLATTTCKKIGAMSWNWPSFQRMSYSPCTFFADDNVSEWIRKVYMWGDSVFESWKETALNGCKGGYAKSARMRAARLNSTAVRSCFE